MQLQLKKIVHGISPENRNYSQTEFFSPQFTYMIFIYSCTVTSIKILSYSKYSFVVTYLYMYMKYKTEQLPFFQFGCIFFCKPLWLKHKLRKANF